MASAIERKSLALPGGHKKMPSHVCRAPCSGEVMEAIQASGPDFTTSLRNPNIPPLKEYELRKNENIRSAERFEIPFAGTDDERDNGLARAMAWRTSRSADIAVTPHTHRA